MGARNPSGSLLGLTWGLGVCFGEDESRNALGALNASPSLSGFLSVVALALKAGGFRLRHIWSVGPIRIKGIMFLLRRPGIGGMQVSSKLGHIKLAARRIIYPTIAHFIPFGSAGNNCILVNQRHMEI